MVFKLRNNDLVASLQKAFRDALHENIKPFGCAVNKYALRDIFCANKFAHFLARLFADCISIDGERIKAATGIGIVMAIIVRNGLNY